MMEEIINNPILKLSNEHKIILDYVSVIDDLLQKNKLGEIPDKLKAMELKFKRDLAGHFDFEEKVFFTAVLLASPKMEMVKFILGLQKAHGELLFELDKLYEIIGILNCSPASIPLGFFSFLGKFTQRVKEHSRLEVENLFPFINVQAHVKNIVKEILTGEWNIKSQLKGE